MANRRACRGARPHDRGQRAGAEAGRGAVISRGGARHHGGRPRSRQGWAACTQSDEGRLHRARGRPDADDRRFRATRCGCCGDDERASIPAGCGDERGCLHRAGPRPRASDRRSRDLGCHGQPAQTRPGELDSDACGTSGRDDDHDHERRSLVERHGGPRTRRSPRRLGARQGQETGRAAEFRRDERLGGLSDRGCPGRPRPPVHAQRRCTQVLRLFHDGPSPSALVRPAPVHVSPDERLPERGARLRESDPGRGQRRPPALVPPRPGDPGHARQSLAQPVEH